jgi:iron(II)-dependent oxidoreductase
MNRTTTELGQMVRDARARTLDLIADLSDEQLMGPRLNIVNPLLWEIGHIAWFQEKWILRHLYHELPGRADADQLYDSAAVAHDTRWDLPLPSRAETLKYILQVRDRVAERIDQGPTFDQVGHGPFSDVLAYFVQLCVFHEDMHTEAFTYTRQTLSYAPPRVGNPHQAGSVSCGATLAGDVEIPGGRHWLGSLWSGSSSEWSGSFIFDNEQWLHPVDLEPFSISRAAVTQAEFAEFVENGGYERPELWSKEGGRWLQSVQATHPVYWKRESNGRWLRRHFDQWVPLQAHRPVIHVNWFEADAYCRWAGRRLPTESEWEFAATGPADDIASKQGEAILIWSPKPRFPWGDDAPTTQHANLDWNTMGCVEVAALPAGDSPFGCRQMIGNVWEWTASDFEPYPGFSPGPYKEYSEPWFGGTHKVLRGGAFSTRSRLIRNTYRNFYTPDRRDVLAGFRTCSLKVPHSLVPTLRVGTRNEEERAR